MADTYELRDLINTAITQKPVDFKNVFDTLIMDKIHTAVENQKRHIAQTFYGHQEEETPVDTTEPDEETKAEEDEKEEDLEAKDQE